MKYLLIGCIATASLFHGMFPTNSLAAESGLLLPESLEARSQMTADEKIVTILILEDKPEKAVALLNKSNDEYAKKGWKLFAINTYTDDEDFEGFFVTYQKKAIVY